MTEFDISYPSVERARRQRGKPANFVVSYGLFVRLNPSQQAFAKHLVSGPWLR